MDKIKQILAKAKNIFASPIVNPTIVMLCICLIIAFALGMTNKVTKPKIAQLEKQTQDASMRKVLKADSYEENTVDDETFYSAIEDGEVIGFVFITTAKGYGGDVKVMTAVNCDGSVKAVNILDVTNETPGLGQNTAKENFYSQFAGKHSGVSVVKNGAKDNEINAVTGATISSTAVTRAVNDALTLYEKTTDGGEAK